MSSKLNDDYDYPHAEWIERDRLAGADRHGRLFRRPARSHRRPSAPAQIRAGPRPRRAARPAPVSMRHALRSGSRKAATAQYGRDGARPRSAPTSWCSPATACSTASTRRPKPAPCRSRTSSSRPSRSAPVRRAASFPAARRSRIPASSSITGGRRRTAASCSAAARPIRAATRPISSPSCGAHLLRIYPQLADVRIDHAWGGTLAVTVNRLPFLRRLKTGVYAASGYSGQGVALAPFGGKIIAEAILGNPGRLDRFAALPCRAVSRRQMAALAGAGRGHELVRAARPDLTVTRCGSSPPPADREPRRSSRSRRGGWRRRLPGSESACAFRDRFGRRDRSM